MRVQRLYEGKIGGQPIMRVVHAQGGERQPGGQQVASRGEHQLPAGGKFLHRDASLDQVERDGVGPTVYRSTPPVRDGRARP